MLEIIKKLNFNRYGGTIDEKKAALIIQKYIEECGGNSQLEYFEIPAYSIEECSLEMIEPYKKEIQCVPYAFSGSLKETITADLIYLERGLESDYDETIDYSNKIVLLNELNYEIYQLLVTHQVLAFIVIDNDKWYEPKKQEDFVPRLLREKMRELNEICGFVIRSCDALELMKNNNVRLKITLKQSTFNTTSQNILSVIEGTKIKNESIVLCAHYDSVINSVGQWDNASGTALLLYIYKYFINHPPKRTMRFIWCGSEEQGLLGSKAYVEKNEQLVGNEIKLCFNFDMVGTILGHNKIFIAGKNDLEELTKKFVKEKSYSSEIKVRIHSSDSASFNKKGIPSISISRGTKTAQIHTCHDLNNVLSEQKLLENAEFAISFILEVINADEIPVSFGMSERLNQAIYDYFEKYKKQP